MKNSGRDTIGETEKHNFLQAVMGSLLMVSLFTGCGSTVSTISKEDLARFNQVPAIRTVHYSPAISFNVTTPGKALAGGGGAIGGLLTLGLSKSAGSTMVEEYAIGDPVLVVKENFMKSLSAGFSGKSITNGEKEFPTDSLSDLQKAYGDGWLIDFATFQWSLTYYPTDWTHYRVFYSARVRLIDLGNSKVVWAGTCKYDHEQGERPTYDQLTANKGELLKARLKQAAEECSQELWAKFQEKGE